MDKFWTSGRDDYGRSQHILHASESTAAHGRTVGAVVRLPRVAIEAGMLPYLSNDWAIRGAAAVQYHRTLAEAKARLEAI